MPDLYATIAEVEVATQERLADILELRAADPQQRAMLDAYLSDVEFAPSARVLEIGCGTGSVVRVLAEQPGVAEVVGVDPSPVFITKARELATASDKVVFEEGTDGLCGSRMATSTRWCCTRRCATFRSLSGRSLKLSGSCAPAGSSLSSTATTRPSRSRSGHRTRCRTASRR